MSKTEFSQKEINSAVGVIRRRRTNFEKKIRRKLPLFAEQVISEYQDQDPLEHLKNRERARFAARLRNKTSKNTDAKFAPFAPMTRSFGSCSAAQFKFTVRPIKNAVGYLCATACENG